jgi:hypothetical protein
MIQQILTENRVTPIQKRFFTAEHRAFKIAICLPYTFSELFNPLKAISNEVLAFFRRVTFMRAV